MVGLECALSEKELISSSFLSLSRGCEPDESHCIPTWEAKSDGAAGSLDDPWPPLGSHRRMPRVLRHAQVCMHAITGLDTPVCSRIRVLCTLLCAATHTARERTQISSGVSEAKALRLRSRAILSPSSCSPRHSGQGG